MLVIISADLCNPPSDILMFRFLTQAVKTNLNSDVILEAQQEAIDIYYKYLVKKGAFDYIDDIQPSFTKEEGVRLDTEPNFPKSIITKSITFQNVTNLLGQIKGLVQI